MVMKRIKNRIFISGVMFTLALALTACGSSKMPAPKTPDKEVSEGRKVRRSLDGILLRWHTSAWTGRSLISPRQSNIKMRKG